MAGRGRIEEGGRCSRGLSSIVGFQKVPTFSGTAKRDLYSWKTLYQGGNRNEDKDPFKIAEETYLSWLLLPAA